MTFEQFTNGTASEACEQSNNSNLENADIKNLVIEWKNKLAEAAELDKKAKEARADANVLAAAIQANLDICGAESVKFKDLGIVYKQTDRKVRLADIDQLCMQQVQQFIQALESGRPLSDALLFQQRPLQSELLKLVDRTPDDAWGVSIINETSVKFRKN